MWLSANTRKRYIRRGSVYKVTTWPWSWPHSQLTILCAMQHVLDRPVRLESRSADCVVNPRHVQRTLYLIISGLHCWAVRIKTIVERCEVESLLSCSLTVNRWRMVVSRTWKYDEPEVENVTRERSPSVTFPTKDRHISTSHNRLCIICFVVWPITKMLNYNL